MSPKQFNAALVKLGFTKTMPNGTSSLGRTELAALIEVDVRTVRRWASGDQPVPPAIGMLLNLMLQAKAGPTDLKA